MRSTSDYELRPPLTVAEWEAYHRIRRTVLLEQRGLFGVYDDHHPDERRVGNHPMVLFRGGEAVGAIRIDVHGAHAIFRRVAVRHDVQRAGHGRVMILLAERFARAQGCRTARSHVDAGAVGFYERCGYVRDGVKDGGATTVLMTKTLADEARTLA